MYNPDFLKELKINVKRWEEHILKFTLEKVKENRKEFRTGSDEFITLPLYTPLDIAETDYNKQIGLAGEFPYTRGIDALGYRAFRLPLGFYAGYGSGENANRRYRQLYAAGSRDIGLALDLPTQLGLDSDDPLAQGEVGKVGLAIDTVEDIDRALKGIPLQEIKTGTVGNCIGPWALAIFLSLCEKRNLDRSQMWVRLQNDPIKEYTGRGTYIFKPSIAIDLASDVVEYMYKNVPTWEWQWSCTTTMRWGGCTAAQEIGFGLANLMCYVEEAKAKGVSPEDYLPKVDLHMSSDNDLLEEVAKFRATRRLWAKLASEHFKTTNPKILSLRLSTYVAANRLTAQEPMNNIVRTTIQVLASMLAGIDHIGVAAYDEALSIPTFKSTRLASLIRQILYHECNIGTTVDALGGSYYLEWLTNQLEEKALYWYQQVQNMGGAINAVENGFYLKAMAEGQYKNQKDIESGEKKVIGVNLFNLGTKEQIPIFKVNPKAEARQIQRLQKVKQKRDHAKVQKALDTLNQVAEMKLKGNRVNIMPAMIEAVRVHATEGEIFNTLRNIFGSYEPPAIY